MTNASGYSNYLTSFAETRATPGTNFGTFAIAPIAAGTMVVTFAGQGLAAPVTLTGTPAVQAFRIGHHEAIITVTASPVAGFAAATVAACRPD